VDAQVPIPAEPVGRFPQLLIGEDPALRVSHHGVPAVRRFANWIHAIVFTSVAAPTAAWKPGNAGIPLAVHVPYVSDVSAVQSGGGVVRRPGECGLGVGSDRCSIPEGRTLLHGVVFLSLAVALVVLVPTLWGTAGWVALLPLYAALSFALLSLGYLGVGSRLLQKRANGRHSPVPWCLFEPYFLLSVLTLGVYRSPSREPAYAQVAPNRYFGRRLSLREAKEAGWASILDLAAEFRATWNPATYRSLPVLDAAAPTEDELRSAVEWVAVGLGSGVRSMSIAHSAMGGVPV
jgi:hypothetical protein